MATRSRSSPPYPEGKRGPGRPLGHRRRPPSSHDLEGLAGRLQTVLVALELRRLTVPMQHHIEDLGKSLESNDDQQYGTCMRQIEFAVARLVSLQDERVWQETLKQVEGAE